MYAGNKSQGCFKVYVTELISKSHSLSSMYVLEQTQLDLEGSWTLVWFGFSL